MNSPCQAHSSLFVIRPPQISRDNVTRREGSVSILKFREIAKVCTCYLNFRCTKATGISGTTWIFHLPFSLIRKVQRCFQNANTNLLFFFLFQWKVEFRRQFLLGEDCSTIFPDFYSLSHVVFDESYQQFKAFSKLSELATHQRQASRHSPKIDVGRCQRVDLT